jgi:SAM-dependent methyltransferase
MDDAQQGRGRSANEQAPPTLDWGALRRTEPIGRRFGFDRGRPIDRYYIEAFLEANRASIAGRVLEIGDANYTRRFGGERVVRSDVYDRPGNPQATLAGDLGGDANLPRHAFDCMIVCQTLLFIYDLRRAMANLRDALAPGGVLLVTVPGISQIVREDMDREGDFWRFTTRSLRDVARECFDPASVEVRSFGNVLTCIGFLHGLAQEDLRQEEMDAWDDDFQLIVALRARA